MNTKLPLKLTLFCFALYFVRPVSLFDPFDSPDDPAGQCALNFTAYPYQPRGDCLSEQENVNVWGTFRTTRCCRNALSALSQALALHANTTNGSIFLSQDLWRSCTGSFFRQHSVSVEACGFRNLFHGSALCSAVDLPSVASEKPYLYALDRCSDLGLEFDEACGHCTTAVLGLRSHLLIRSGVTDEKDEFESALCGFGAITAVTAGNLRNSSAIYDYYRCLRALDFFETDFLKIRYSVAKAVVASVVATVSVTLIIALVKYVTKKKKKKTKKKRSAKPLPSDEASTWSGLYIFSKDEIENATKLGNEKKSLGRGSAGEVYKGILPSGQVVAIKKIYNNKTSDSFMREVEGLSRVRHRNLVCLLGCCSEDGEQYLVYEFCPQGDLAKHLLRKETLLTWEIRVKILRDCALALKYLQQRIDGCLVHRDIKLTNILLTDKLEPKLSDFGLARMLGMDETKVFTDVRGTIGYMDPEYMTNAKLTCASDIYSFGIVTLQLLSGQKVIDLDLDARDQLTRKAKDVAMGLRPLEDFEDPRLRGNINKADFESILKVAVLCVAKSSSGRPSVGLIFEELDKAWKNTVSHKMSKKEMSSSATPIEIILV